MKNIVKGLVAGHFLRKMKHRRALHSIGGAALALGRTKMVLGLGAAALAADYLRKRKARKAMTENADLRYSNMD